MNIIGYDHGDFKDGVLFSLSENLALRGDLSAAASTGGMSSPSPTARLGLVRAETVNLFVSSSWAWPLGGDDDDEGGDDAGRRPSGISGLGIDCIIIPSEFSPLTTCSSSLAGKEVWAVILVYGLYLYAEEFPHVQSLWLMFVQDVITENYIKHMF